MDPQSLIARFGLVTATFIVSFVSAIFPPINTEVFLLAVAAIAKPAALPAVLLAAAVGQMAGKSLFYLAGRGLLKLPLGRYQQTFDEWTVRLGRSSRGVALVMLSSATWGVPPFLVVPYLAGLFKLSFLRFWALGLLGRLLRFAAILALPAVLKAIAR